VIDLHIARLTVAVKGFGDEFLLAPVDVPVVVLCLPVLSAFQSRKNAVGEVRLECQLRTELGVGLLVHGVVLLPNVLAEVLAHDR